MLHIFSSTHPLYAGTNVYIRYYLNITQNKNLVLTAQKTASRLRRPAG